ncbi:hypothetical protein ASC75_13880 [Aminobacter sp. DSM 101952]|nr:hypothetical protein ASC75_13880 [Aminobacter sp. DSM 101952]
MFLTEEVPLLAARCLISWNFDNYFERLGHDIDDVVLQLLGQRTLADALADIDLIDQARRDPSRACAEVEIGRIRQA